MAMAVFAAVAAPDVLAEGFDQYRTGAPPPNWTCGMTGRGTPVWIVQADPTAPSQPNVLLQSGSATYPWCVQRDVQLADGFVETRFKSIDGREDQAAGVVWRWKNADHYYVARANALENNVSLYYVERGVRRTLKYADAPVPRARWSTLRVEFSGQRIRVLLDRQSRIEIDDGHIAGAGSVGVWTKADSVTAFDDFAYGPAQ
jgi:hypothetical protein